TVAVRPRTVQTDTAAPVAAATRAASAHGSSSVITAPEAASAAARAAASAAPATRCAVTAAPPTAASPRESVAVTVRMPAASTVPAIGCAPLAFEAHRLIRRDEGPRRAVVTAVAAMDVARSQATGQGAA